MLIIINNNTILRDFKNINIWSYIVREERCSPALFTSQTITMAPRLANLRAVNLPRPLPPPVTRVISPAMLFILYFNGMNKLMIVSMQKITVQKMKTITALAVSKNDIFVPFFFFFSLIEIFVSVPNSFELVLSLKLRSLLRSWGRSGWHSSSYVYIKVYGRMMFAWKT